MTLEFHGSTPDIYELGQLAEQATQGISPTELHGALCGVFAAGGTQADLIGLVGEDALTDQDSLAAFWHACLTVAYSHDLDFMPVLNVDEEDHVSTRVDALAQWSATFLAGYTRLKEFGQIVGDTKEILQDLARVAQADTDMDESEANEADYVELYEFVRVAGLLLFTDAIEHDADAEDTLH